MSMIEKHASNQSGKLMTDTYFCKAIIAGRKMEIESHNKRVIGFFKDYFARFSSPDFIIPAVSPGEVSQVLDDYMLSVLREGVDLSIATEFPYEEICLIHQNVSDWLIGYNTLLLHGAAISVDEHCFIFTAPSGTGKSTHINNWLKVIPETIVINGDKPYININNKKVYGTPWCGKEGLNTNTSSTLSAIVILERGTHNSIVRIPFHELLPVLLQQIYIPKERQLAIKAYQLIGELKGVPSYRLTCNIEKESAMVAYDRLMGDIGGNA